MNEDGREPDRASLANEAVFRKMGLADTFAGAADVLASVVRMSLSIGTQKGL